MGLGPYFEQQMQQLPPCWAENVAKQFQDLICSELANNTEAAMRFAADEAAKQAAEGVRQEVAHVQASCSADLVDALRLLLQEELAPVVRATADEAAKEAVDKASRQLQEEQCVAQDMLVGILK